MKKGLEYLGSEKFLAFADQALVSGCNFILLIYVGKNLPAMQFGLFSLAMLLISFLSGFHRALLTRPMEILGIKEDELRMHSRHMAVLLANIGVAPICVSLLVFVSIFLINDPEIIVSASICLISSFFQDTMRRYWYCTKNLKHALLSDTISYGGQTIVTLIFIEKYTLSAETIFVIMAVTSLVAFFIDLIILRRKRRILNRDLPRLSMSQVLKEHWTISKWICLSILVIWSSAQVYPIFISYLGTAAVASYAACGILLRAVNLPVQVVDNYLPLQVSRILKENGVEELKQHLKVTIGRTVLISSTIVGVIYLYAPWLLYVIYNGLYDSSVTVLRLLLPASFFLFLGAVLGSYSNAMLDMRASFLSNLIGAIWTFTAGIWLVYSYGIHGAAIAASLNAAITALVQAIAVLLRIRAIKKMEYVTLD